MERKKAATHQRVGSQQIDQQKEDRKITMLIKEIQCGVKLRPF